MSNELYPNTNDKILGNLNSLKSALCTVTSLKIQLCLVIRFINVDNTEADT